MANVHNVDVDRIKLRAKAFGISLEFLNQCIGKYRGFLSCVRNGTDRIDEDELAVIADKINTTVAYLTGQTDDAERPTKPPDMPNKNTLRPEELSLVERIKTMSVGELRQVSDFVDFVIAKRNKG